MLKLRPSGNLQTHIVTPLLDQDAIQWSINTTVCVKSTKEYFRGN